MYYYHTRPTWRHWVGWYYHPGSRRRQAAASPWSLNIQYIVKTKISTLQPPVQRNGSLPSWRWTSSSLKNDLKFYCELSALPSDLLLPGDYAQVGPAQGHLGDDPTEKLQDSLGDKGPHWSRPQVNWTNLVWYNIIVKLAVVSVTLPVVQEWSMVHSGSFLRNILGVSVRLALRSYHPCCVQSGKGEDLGVFPG